MVQLLQVHPLAVLFVHRVQQQGEQIGLLTGGGVLVQPAVDERRHEGVHVGDRGAQPAVPGDRHAQRWEGEPEERAEDGVGLAEGAFESLALSPTWALNSERLTIRNASWPISSVTSMLPPGP